jgi:uncharacterized protein HemX
MERGSRHGRTTRIPPVRHMAEANGNGNGNKGSAAVSWIAIAMSVAISLGGAFWTVANPRDDIKQVEARLQSQIDKMLPRSVHDESILRLDRDIARLADELLRQRGSSVTRDEMSKFEFTNSSRLEGQANRLLTLENELHGSSNIGKAMDRMQEHIQDLDRRLLGIVKDAAPKPNT